MLNKIEKFFANFIACAGMDAAERMATDLDKKINERTKKVQEEYRFRMVPRNVVPRVSELSPEDKAKQAQAGQLHRDALSLVISTEESSWGETSS